MNPVGHRWRCWRTRRSLARRDAPDFVRRHVEEAARISWNASIDQVRFVVLDAEMTGLGEDDRLVSLGAVGVRGGRVDLGDSFQRLVDPGRDMTRPAIAVHRILPEEAAGRPDASEVLPGFLDYIGAAVLVGHNVRWDRDFIDREMIRHFGLRLQSPMVDVYRLSRTENELKTRYGLGRPQDDHSLDALAAAMDLSMLDRHTAAGDALITALVFLRLVKSLKRFGLAKLGRLFKYGGI
jgi:DNA polymerase-3 subunit epsilon